MTFREALIEEVAKAFHEPGRDQRLANNAAYMLLAQSHTTSEEVLHLLSQIPDGRLVQASSVFGAHLAQSQYEDTWKTILTDNRINDASAHQGMYQLVSHLLEGIEQSTDVALQQRFMDVLMENPKYLLARKVSRNNTSRRVVKVFGSTPWMLARMMPRIPLQEFWQTLQSRNSVDILRMIAAKLIDPSMRHEDDAVVENVVREVVSYVSLRHAVGRRANMRNDVPQGMVIPGELATLIVCGSEHWVNQYTVLQQVSDSWLQAKHPELVGLPAEWIHEALFTFRHRQLGEIPADKLFTELTSFE